MDDLFSEHAWPGYFDPAKLSQDAESPYSLVERMKNTLGSGITKQLCIGRHLDVIDCTSEKSRISSIFSPYGKSTVSTLAESFITHQIYRVTHAGSGTFCSPFA